jgi:hypothetical protein
VSLQPIAALPKPTTGPILVLVAESSRDGVTITFPCHSKEESRGAVEWFGSGNGDDVLMWLDRHWGPDCPCDECGERMGEDVPDGNLNLFFLTASGLKTYFLCRWCGENWKASGAVAPPNVFAKLEAGIDYRKRANA